MAASPQPAEGRCHLPPAGHALPQHSVLLSTCPFEGASEEEGSFRGWKAFFLHPTMERPTTAFYETEGTPEAPPASGKMRRLRKNMKICLILLLYHKDNIAF